MNEQSTPPKICCPKCGSDQLFAGKKGFSGTKAVGGALLTGGIGLLAGTIGSNKIKITCLACGNVFKPGDVNKKITPAPEVSKGGSAVFVLIVLVLLVVAIMKC